MPSDETVPSTADSLVRSLATSPVETREDAIAWLRSARLLSDDDEITNSEFAALLRLRDALRDVLAARAAGRLDQDAAARLTRALADGRLVVTITPAGDARLASSARATYSSVVAGLAIVVAESAITG